MAGGSNGWYTSRQFSCCPIPITRHTLDTISPDSLCYELQNFSRYPLSLRHPFLTNSVHLHIALRFDLTHPTPPYALPCVLRLLLTDVHATVLPLRRYPFIIHVCTLTSRVFDLLILVRLTPIQVRSLITPSHTQAIHLLSTRQLSGIGCRLYLTPRWHGLASGSGHVHRRTHLRICIHVTPSGCYHTQRHVCSPPPCHVSQRGFACIPTRLCA